MSTILKSCWFPSLALLLLNASLPCAWGQGTAFYYQGELNDGGNPADGLYDFQFSIYDAATVGNLVAGPLTLSANGVTNGLFTVSLDFGAGVFNGSARWLQMAVRTNGASVFVTLAPRQELEPTPYAITAENLTGIVASGGLSGTYNNAVTLNNPANQFTGTFVGDGSGLNGVNAASLGGLGSASFWQLGGNNVSGGQFLGSTNSQPLELRVDGMRALRLEPNASGAPSVLGGSVKNYIEPGVAGAFIGGGGATNYLGQVYSNHIAADFGVIGGGYQNTILGTSSSSMIGAGHQNTIQAFVAGSFIGAGNQNSIAVPQSFVGAGYNNSIQGNFADLPSFIGGGSANTIQAGCSQSVLSGGANNAILTGSPQCVIGGGQFNAIWSNASFSTIAGGSHNAIETNASQSVIGGGTFNSILSNAPNSTVAGGVNNLVGGGAGYGFIGGGEGNGLVADHSAVAGGRQNIVWNRAGGSFIGGGIYNEIETNSLLSVIGGGSGNLIDHDSVNGFIGGGTNNFIGPWAYFATIAGGWGNLVTNGQWGTVAGGYQNISSGYGSAVGGGEQNTASGDTSSVVGGDQNVSTGVGSAVLGGWYNQAQGQLSIACGMQAQALHGGTFVWADVEYAPFASTRPNQFALRAGGGVLMKVSGSSGLNPAALEVNSTSGNGVAVFAHQTSTDATAVFANSGTGDILKGFSGATGGNLVLEVLNSGDTYATSFNSTCDRNAKAGFEPIDPKAILERVATLPISRWHYTNNAATPHLGPMAQDFHAAFDVGPDDKHITTIDEGGVALAAIQGLNRKLEEKLSAQNARLQELEERNAALEKCLEELESRAGAR